MWQNEQIPLFWIGEFLARLSEGLLCNSTLFVNFNVLGRSPLHGVSLCTSVSSWDRLQSGGIHVSFLSVEFRDYCGLDALHETEMDPTLKWGNLLMVSFFFTSNMNGNTFFPREELSDLGNMHYKNSYQHICVQMCRVYIIYVDALEIV